MFHIQFSLTNRRPDAQTDWDDSGPTNGQNKEMAKFLSFPKQRMAMAIHQIAKIQIGEWPVKTLSLANPNAY